MFAFEDVLKDTELYPVPPTPLVVDGEMARMEKLDSDTVRFVFGKPSSLFLEWLSTPDTPPLLKPRHYLERFHKTYNKNIDGLVKDEGFAKWTDLFLAKDDPWRNPDLPVLNAWRVVKPLGKSGDRTLFERNPYYWKTDPHGSQLPYLDQVSYQILQDLNVASLKTTNGDIDFNHPTFTGGVCTSANKPVLARNRDSGGYHFIEGRLETMNQMVVYFNLCDKDPVLRKVFRNRDFRIGLSYAIKRQEITEAVFQRQGEPWQAAPRRESEFFHEKLAKQYTEYDPDRANRHLDAAGLAGRDSAGLRLRPDGERLSFDMEVVTEEPEEIDALELIRGYWREVGVEMRVKTEDRTLFYDRKSANLHQAGVWTGDGGWGDVRLQPQWYFPAFGEANWAIPWATWYLTGGKDGEEPPAPAKRQMALYDRLTSTVDKSAQRDLFMQILDVSQEQFWLLGTVMSPGTYGTVKNDFHNVPGRIPGAWEYPSPGPTRPEQYWVEA